MMSINSSLTKQHFSNQMFNKETAIGMLKVANTAEEILSILDVIVADQSQEVSVTDFNGNAVEF